MRKYRRHLFLFIGLVALGILVYKFRNSITLDGFHWSVVGQSLRQARISLLLLGIVATYGCFAVRSLRWIRFCRSLGPVKFRDVFSATISGFACVFLLGRAGEPVRPVLISRKSGLSMPGMFGVYVLERVSDVAAAGVIAILALLFFEPSSQHLEGSGASIMKLAHSAAVGLLAGLTAVILFLVYFRYHGAGWLAGHLRQSQWRHGWRGKIILLLEGFSEGLQGIRTASDLAVLTAYTALHWGLIALIYLWIAHAFPGKLSLLPMSSMLLVLAFGLVGSTLQFPGVGGGAQVATFLVFTLILGVDKESAATVSIMIWLITFASSALLGLPILLHEGWSMGELRKMAQSEEHRGEEELLAEAEAEAEAVATSKGDNL